MNTKMQKCRRCSDWLPPKDQLIGDICSLCQWENANTMNPEMLRAIRTMRNIAQL